MVQTVKTTIARRSLPLPLLDRPDDLAARVNGRLFHAALRNRSQKTRRVLIF